MRNSKIGGNGHKFEWGTMAIGIARDPYGLRQLGQYRGKGDSMIEGELLQKKDQMYRILSSIVHTFLHGK